MKSLFVFSAFLVYSIFGFAVIVNEKIAFRCDDMRKRIPLIFFSLLFLMLSVSSCRFSQWIVFPDSEQGALDLSEIEFDYNAETIRLRGEWEFYWGQLIEPEEFQGDNPPLPDTYISVPGIWNGTEIDGKKINGKGVATYRLLVELPADYPMPGFYIYNQATSYRFYVNGDLMVSNGNVSDNPDEFRPSYNVNTVTYYASTNQLELIFQVANYAHRKGGLWNYNLIGPADRIQRLRKKGWCLMLLSFLHCWLCFYIT